MKTVGLTGGIGSGKSIVLKIFSSLGVPSYIADERSKSLLNSNSSLKEKLISTFGAIYVDDKIDRQAFADIIFNDKKKLEKSNNIIHPFVQTDFEEWLKFQKSPYIIKETAILFEIGGHVYFDKNILVSAPKELRIKRLQKRNDFSLEEINDRMESQWSDDKKRLLADYIILNDEDHSLIEQVLKIHQELSS